MQYLVFVCTPITFEVEGKMLVKCIRKVFTKGGGVCLGKSYEVFNLSHTHMSYTVDLDNLHRRGKPLLMSQTYVTTAQCTVEIG